MSLSLLYLYTLFDVYFYLQEAIETRFLVLF